MKRSDGDDVVETTGFIVSQTGAPQQATRVNGDDDDDDDDDGVDDNDDDHADDNYDDV